MQPRSRLQHTGTLQHDAKGRKPVTKDHTLYDPISKEGSQQANLRSLFRAGRKGGGGQEVTVDGDRDSF